MEIYNILLLKPDLDKCLEIASYCSKIEDVDQWFWLKEVGHCLALKEKDLDGLAEYYMQSLEIHESLLTRLELIMILQKRSDQRCVNELKILISKYPNCIQAYELNAQVLGTVDAYRKVINLDPYHGLARFKLTDEKLKSGKEVVFIYMFKIMETCHSVPSEVYLKWSDLAKETGQWDFISIGFWLANQATCSSS